MIIALGEEISQGLGALDPRIRPVRGAQGVLRRADRLRRPRRRGRAQARLPTSSPTLLAGSKSGAATRSPAEQLERVLTIDAEVPLGVLSLRGRRGDREARAARDRQSPAAAAGDRPRGRRRAAPGRREEKPPSAPAQAGRPRLSRRSPGTWPKRAEAITAGSRLSAVFSARRSTSGTTAAKCSSKSRISWSKAKREPPSRRPRCSGTANGDASDGREGLA